MTKELKLFVDCLNDIDAKYYLQEITKLVDNRIEGTGNFRFNESTFVTQLIGKVQNKFRENAIHTSKHFETDPPKHLVFRNGETAARYSKTFNPLFRVDADEFYKVPDIVIHGGPHDFNPGNQILLSEVKITPTLSQSAFDIDLFKVNVYHEELKFQNSIFVIVNKKLHTIDKYLERYMKSGYFLSLMPGLSIIVKPSYRDDVIVVDPRLTNAERKDQHFSRNLYTCRTVDCHRHRNKYATES